MPEELFKLLAGLGLSLILSAIIIVPVIIWRVIRRKPILPKGEKIESPTLFYIGITVFCGFALLAFIINMPYFGSAIMLMLLAFVCGLIAFKRGWRG